MWSAEGCLPKFSDQHSSTAIFVPDSNRCTIYSSNSVMCLAINYIKILTTDSRNNRTPPSKCHSDKGRKDTKFMLSTYTYPRL